MNNYFEFFLLGILVVLLYKKPLFLQNIQHNRLYLVLLICLNAYISNKFGITSGIIMALIVIVLIDSKETFCNNEKDDSQPKVNVKSWRPANFTSPCQTENDRILKIRSEVSTLNATK
tara:strand:- start:220 stop:573 length:354 start_codon:yes stop_codon:yes gene_type:complete